MAAISPHASSSARARAARSSRSPRSVGAACTLKRSMNSWWVSIFRGWPGWQSILSLYCLPSLVVMVSFLVGNSPFWKPLKHSPR